MLVIFNKKSFSIINNKIRISRFDSNKTKDPKNSIYNIFTNKSLALLNLNNSNPNIQMAAKISLKEKFTFIDISNSLKPLHQLKDQFILCPFCNKFYASLHLDSNNISSSSVYCLSCHKTIRLNEVKIFYPNIIDPSYKIMQDNYQIYKSLNKNIHKKWTIEKKRLIKLYNYTRNFDRGSKEYNDFFMFNKERQNILDNFCIKMF